jgi:hypothetical protein
VVLVQFARIIEEEGGDPMSVVDYFSTLPYVDRVNGIAYNDCIIGLPEFNRELTGDLFANYQSSHGNLELDNTDGELDYLLDAHCDGSQQQYFVGDVSWPLADFRDLFTAITVNVEAPSLSRLPPLSRLVVSLKDSSALLEQNIGGVDKVGGTGPYADRWRPLVFGYLRQYEYLVQDEVELRYVYADNTDGHFIGEQEQIVYDRGVPVDFANNGDGTVTLLASPDGAISGNVHATPQGDDTQWLMSDALLELVGERAGFITNSLWAGPHATYIDDGDEDWPVGILISDKRSLLKILEELADSGLLFWAINRSGLFTYGRIRPSYIEGLNVASSATITLDEIDDIDIERLDPQYHRLQALMARNWFTSDDLAASLTAEERAALSRPGLYGIQGNSVGSTYEEAPERYNLTLTESPVIETLLSGWNDEDDALVLDAWMEVRRAMFLPWLDLVTVTVDLTYYTLELGDVVTVQIPRFGWDAGVTFQVISITMRPVEGKIRLKLIRRHIQGPYEGRVTNAQEEPESADLEVGFGEIVQPPIGIPPLPGDEGGMNDWFPQTTSTSVNYFRVWYWTPGDPPTRHEKKIYQNTLGGYTFYYPNSAFEFFVTWMNPAIFGVNEYLDWEVTIDSDPNSGLSQGSVNANSAEGIDIDGVSPNSTYACRISADQQINAFGGFVGSSFTVQAQKFVGLSFIENVNPPLHFECDPDLHTSIFSDAGVSPSYPFGWRVGRFDRSDNTWHPEFDDLKYPDWSDPGNSNMCVAIQLPHGIHSLWDPMALGGFVSPGPPFSVIAVDEFNAPKNLEDATVDPWLTTEALWIFWFTGGVAPSGTVVFQFYLNGVPFGPSIALSEDV